MNKIISETEKLTKFNSTEQRIIASFYLTMPNFHGYKTNHCTIEEQKNLYDFINNLYELLYNEPKLLFNSLNEDYGFPNVFTFANSGNEEFTDVMRKEHKEVFSLIELIRNIGKEGAFTDEVVEYSGKISKRIKNIFQLNGLEISNNYICNKKKPFFNALKWFAKQDINLRKFSNCSFDPEYDYLSDVLAPLCEKEEGAIKEILDWLKDNNYEVFSLITKYDNNNDYSVHYVKNINKRKDKIGFPYMGDPNHIGFSMEYRYTGRKPYFCTIRIQNMKKILLNFNDLPIDVKNLIIKVNKQCDSCNYCIQTDKTNKRPKANIIVHYNEFDYMLCPLYPGYSYSFTDITKKDAKSFIDFMKIIELYNLN